MPIAWEPFEPVCVTWEDAKTDASVQCTNLQDAFDSYCPTIRKTHGIYVGYAENDGRKCLLIATDDDRSEHEIEACGGISYIPAGMVIKITRPASKRKKKAQPEPDHSEP